MKATTTVFALLLLLAAATTEASLRGLQIDGSSKVQESGYHHKNRIIGGNIANAKEYPFMVHIGACGGSLIHQDIVLSAAHCTVDNNPTALRVGGSNINNGVPRRIVAEEVHPLYETLAGAAQIYDFVLYKLDSPVPITPVVLNTNASWPSWPLQSQLTVLGYGSTTYTQESGAGGGSFDLHEVDIHLWDHDRCNRHYQGFVDNTTMFCAGRGGHDACKGDSGGPILDSMGIQVGVTSWGRGCGVDAGVYARVSAVMDWIQDQICELSDYPPTSCRTGLQFNGTDSNSTYLNSTDVNVNGDTTFDGDELVVIGDNAGVEIAVAAEDSAEVVVVEGNSIRIDIYFDQYPWESAWHFFNDDTDEPLYEADIGDIKSGGLQSFTFPNLEDGRYVFLLFDSFNDGLENGYVEVYQVYPKDSGRGDELIWRHDGGFEGVIGSAFRSRAGEGITREVDSRGDFSTSPRIKDFLP